MLRCVRRVRRSRRLCGTHAPPSSPDDGFCACRCRLAFLLVEHLTGIRATERLLKDSTFRWDVVPAPAKS
ncbi:DUF6461 domain-containing protein [Nonomuraea terrae]|uniref:DUF6461 domain-containing protein n=1 Tax=Nonomuraea terrae TaxID=2530383 RepID=UPI001CB71637